jgi:hypothetical protein
MYLYRNFLGMRTITHWHYPNSTVFRYFYILFCTFGGSGIQYLAMAANLISLALPCLEQSFNKHQMYRVRYPSPCLYPNKNIYPILSNGSCSKKLLRLNRRAKCKHADRRSQGKIRAMMLHYSSLSLQQLIWTIMPWRDLEIMRVRL